MADRVDPTGLFGLCVFGTPASAVTDIGGGTRDSSFTEDGPIPGTPVAVDASTSWRPAISGAQSIALEVVSVRGGFAGLAGARIVYRLAADTSPRDYRGWNEGNFPSNWSAPSSGWGAAATYGLPAAAALPSGRIAVIAPDASATNAGQSWTYDPRTEVWADGFDWSTGAGVGLPVALAYDPGTGRLIAWAGAGDAGDPSTIAYASTDEGDTWVLYSRGMYPVTVATTDRVRIAVDPGGADWLGMLGAEHVASSDRGVTFRSVATLTAAASGTAYVPVRTNTGWAIVYIRTSDLAPCVRLLAGPGSSFDGATEIVVAPNPLSPTPAGDIVACVDEDGAFYVLARGTVGEATRHIVTLYRSLDGGITWAAYSWAISLGSDSRILALQDLVPSCGALHLLFSQNGGAAGDVAGTVAMVSLGGWSQIEAGLGLFFTAAGDPTARVTYGVYEGAVDAGRFWFPFAAPEAMGWSRPAGTGTRDFDTVIPGMRITTTGGTTERYTYLPNVGEYTCGEAALRTIAGTSADLATLGTAGGGVGIQPELGDGAVLYAPEIDIGTDGIQVRDGSTIRATVAVDTTAAIVHVRWMLRPGAVTVWYRQKGVDRPEVWHRIANDVAVTSSGATALSGVAWGHGTLQDGDAVWQFVGVAASGEFLSGIDSAADASLTSADGVRGLRWGRAIPGAGTRGYPLPEATDTTEDLGYIAATGGPSPAGTLSEVSLPVAYEYPIEALDPEVSPSPSAPWRAASDATQTIVYDLGAPVWNGGAVALVILRATTPEVAVEFDNGSTGWAAATTVSMALVATWNYTLTGRVAVPRTGTDVLDRYVGPGELVGAWALVSTSGGAKYRRIVANSGGYWTLDPTKQQIRITFAAEGEDGGIDGTEDASGTGTLYHHSAVHVAYPAADTARRYVRITVAAVTGGGVPSAGILAAARVIAVGAEPDWAWTRTMSFARTLSRDGADQPAIRRRGPPRWTWAYPWTGGIALGRLRREDAVDETVAVSGGVAIGTMEDATYTWLGVLEHDLRSGEVPVVALAALPDDDATITDPSLYLYGLMVAEAVTVTGVVGDEGVDEVVRLDGPVIEEVR